MQQQRHRSILLALALVLVLAVPPAAATWAGRGFYEPDTDRDRTEGWMFADPDTSTDINVRQVYFNAYTAHANAGGNPNLGTTHSSHIAPVATNFYAFLGVWKDCNDDGYIGMQEGALLEYRSEILGVPDICPAGQSQHNDGEWVYEFIWIGPDDVQGCSDPAEYVPEDDDDNPYNLVDNCARVWMDIGYPEASGEVTCPINPQPRGTYQRVGGVMRYADCIANYRIYDGVNTVAGPLDDATGTQVSFDDAPKENPQFSESILNQRNPYGHESEGSMVAAFDCSGEGTTVDDPTGDGLRRVEVRDPTGALPTEVVDPVGGETTSLTNDDGSYAAVNFTDDDHELLTIHDTGSGAPDVDGSSPAGTGNETLEASPHVGFRGVFVAGTGVTASNGVGGDCDRSDGGLGENADLYEAAESDFEPSSPKRTDTDQAYTFSENPPSGDDESPYAGLGQTGDRTPYFYGVGVARDSALIHMRWGGSPFFTVSRNPIIRSDDFQPQRAQPFTFYAYVDPMETSRHGLSLPAGPVLGVYGDEHCDELAPTTGFWECDPDLWYRDSNGADIRGFWNVAVGDPYNLRDIDCYDETYVEGQPETTTHALTGTSCARRRVSFIREQACPLADEILRPGPRVNLGAMEV